MPLFHCLNGKRLVITLLKKKLVWHGLEYITVPYKKHNEQVLFDELLVFFDKEKIANLTLVIIQINSWNRLMESFAIEAGNYQVGSISESKYNSMYKQKNHEHSKKYQMTVFRCI